MTLVPVHVIGGIVGIVTGLVALYALKGATLHRRSGTIFVYAMLVMALSGAVIAVGRVGAAMNIPAGLVTAYLVVTALMTVRPPSAGSRRVERGAMLAAFVIGLSSVAAASFFLGPARRVPEPLRALPFRLIPLVVLVTMVYWLWRLRRRRISHSAVVITAPEAI